MLPWVRVGVAGRTAFTTTWEMSTVTLAWTTYPTGLVTIRVKMEFVVRVPVV